MPVFNRRARLDTSQVEDRRGGRAVAIGGIGGGLGLLVLLVTVLLGGNPADLAGSDPSQSGGVPGGSITENCRSAPTRSNASTGSWPAINPATWTPAIRSAAESERVPRADHIA